MFFTPNSRSLLVLALALAGAGATSLTASASSPQLSLRVPPEVPAGTVLPFAGATVPAGYLLCDGSEVLRSKYPALYGAIGPAWGAATGFTFTLPDLRGRFLRGVDGGAGNDPDRNSRTAINTGGNVGDDVGSLQGDGRRGFSGTFSGTTATAGAHSHQILTRQDDWDEDDGDPGHQPGWADDARSSVPRGHFNDTELAGDHTHSFSLHVAFTGESETRPQNADVNYIIKF